MRILVDATAVGEGGGGICTFLLGLLSGWNEAGFADEWRIIGMDDLPAAVDDLVAPSGTVRRAMRPSVARRILSQQCVLPAMTHRRTWPPDVLLATTPVIPVVPSGVPILAMVHDLRFLRFPNEFAPLTRLYRRVAYGYGLRRADGLVVNSQFTGDEVRQFTRGGSASPQVVHLGADHVDTWPLDRASGHGIAFAHWSNKRPDVAIRAWGLLRDKRVGFRAILHIVGAEPAEIERLTRLAVELDLAHMVRIHPFLAEHEYRALFAASSIVLLLSTTEGFGLPVAEAQRLGIPVVATPVGGMLEAGGDAALFTSDGSPASVAALCAEALFDPRRRADLIGRGRIHAQRFTWRSTAELTRAEMERCRQRWAVRHRTARCQAGH